MVRTAKGPSSVAGQGTKIPVLIFVKLNDLKAKGSS